MRTQTILLQCLLVAVAFGGGDACGGSDAKHGVDAGDGSAGSAASGGTASSEGTACSSCISANCSAEAAACMPTPHCMDEFSCMRAAIFTAADQNGDGVIDDEESLHIPAVPDLATGCAAGEAVTEATTGLFMCANTNQACQAACFRSSDTQEVQPDGGATGGGGGTSGAAGGS